ncbi:MAG: hypothetical protein H7A41_05575 [Chlamydiales bacterium]|nr:hypothetical protein [Chlamydiales bacterium]
MGPVIAGSYLAGTAIFFNGGIAIGIAAAAKRGWLHFSSTAGVPISAAVIGLTGTMTFMSKESIF